MYSNAEAYLSMALLIFASAYGGVTMCAILDNNAMLAGSFGGMFILTGVSTVYAFARLLLRDK